MARPQTAGFYSADELCRRLKEADDTHQTDKQTTLGARQYFRSAQDKVM